MSSTSVQQNELENIRRTVGELDGALPQVLNIALQQRLKGIRTRNLYPALERFVRYSADPKAESLLVAVLKPDIVRFGELPNSPKCKYQRSLVKMLINFSDLGEGLDIEASKSLRQLANHVLAGISLPDIRKALILDRDILSKNVNVALLGRVAGSRLDSEPQQAMEILDQMSARFFRYSDHHKKPHNHIFNAHGKKNYYRIVGSRATEYIFKRLERLGSEVDRRIAARLRAHFATYSAHPASPFSFLDT